MGAGQFSIAGGATALRVARWDGASWWALGTGLSGAYLNNPSAYALTTFGTRLVAGGLFDFANGIGVNNIAAWDGTAWSAFGNGLPGIDFSPVWAVSEFQGQLYAGGRFDLPGPGGKLARWNGTQWEQFGGGTLGVWEIHAFLNDGDRLLAAGALTAIGGIPANAIAAWDGSAWLALGEGVQATIAAVTQHRGQIVVGGSFNSQSGQWAAYGCTCYADCNDDAALNLSDFGCFQTKFALGDPYADCNGDAALNLSDFGCFQTKFALGCP